LVHNFCTCSRLLLIWIHAIPYFLIGIICGSIWGSFPVRDHLRFNLGIICGPGSFANPYRTVLTGEPFKSTIQTMELKQRSMDDGFLLNLPFWFQKEANIMIKDFLVDFISRNPQEKSDFCLINIQNLTKFVWHFKDWSSFVGK